MLTCKFWGLPGGMRRELIVLAEEQKKSFVLYFDMYPSIRTLPTDQKGFLLEAVFEYAQAAAERGSPPEEVLARHPDMSQECRMAFRFVAETIRRDTEKWKEKHKRYSEAARARCEKGHGSEAGDSEKKADNNTWMRKNVRQNQNNGTQDAWKYI